MRNPSRKQDFRKSKGRRSVGPALNPETRARSQEVFDYIQRRKAISIEAAHGVCTECGKRTGLGVCPPCRESA